MIASQIEQIISKELGDIKGQQIFLKKIVDNFREIREMDNNIVKSLKLFPSEKDDQNDTRLENIEVRCESMDKLIDENEKILNTCE